MKTTTRTKPERKRRKRKRSPKRKRIDLGLALLACPEFRAKVGITATARLSHKAIAAICECSAEHIRRIEKAALAKLRHRLDASGLGAELRSALHAH